MVGPTWQALARLRTLASAALAHLDACLLIPAHTMRAAGEQAALAFPQTPPPTGAASGGGGRPADAPKDAADAAAADVDRASRVMLSRLFDPPTHDFDILLKLTPSKLPHAHLSWIPASSEPLGIKFSSAHPMAAPRIQGFAKNSRASGKLKRNWPMNCPF